MIGTTTGTLVSAAAAAWFGIAIAATLVGLRRAKRGEQAVREARAVADLLAGAPAVPVLVYPDGRIDADPRIAAWLGLGAVPLRLAELGGMAGIAADDLAALADAVARAWTGTPIDRSVALEGSPRRLAARGGPYSVAGRERQAILLWFFDTSGTHERLVVLEERAARMDRAIEALSAVIESAPFPMWHRAPDLSLSLVNGAYVTAVEAPSADDVVARGVELIGGSGAEGARANAAAACGDGVVRDYIAPAIMAGERRLMRFVDVPIGAVGVAGYAIDIQELEEARTGLALFMRAQHDMLDRLSAAVAQFAGDRGLVFHNRRFAQLFAMAPEWLADRPDFDRVLERMREAQRAPEIRDFPGWRAERRAWFVTREAVEESWLLPGGTHLRVVAQPLPDQGLLLIFEDRTEHLQLTSARDTLLRVRTATFDNLFEAIGVFAGDGRLQLWNNRFGEVWGVSGDDLARRPRIDALVQAIAPRLADPARAAQIRDRLRIATVERQNRSGRISLIDGRHFDFAAVPLPDGNALFTLLDVTASRQQEEALRDRNDALEATDRLRNDFVQKMSRELRDPLNAITGFADMLAAGHAGELGDRARDYVAAIQSAAGSLAALTGDALDLTQGEMGSPPTAREPVALADAARDALDRARKVAWNAGLTLAAEIAPESGTILADRQRLTQAIDHILRNALAYTPAGGRVLVRARRDGMRGEIVIVDTGRGIAPDLLRRLTARFDRSDLAPKEVAAPRGFGLALARQLIESHGGTLDLASQEGRGTTVTIRLPLATDADG